MNTFPTLKILEVLESKMKYGNIINISFDTNFLLLLFKTKEVKLWVQPPTLKYKIK